MRTWQVIGALAVVTSACGSGGDADGTLQFGATSEPCAPTVLTNDVNDSALARQGSDCFLAAVEGGAPVVWDVLQPTVEGDPIPIRYEYNGTAVRITRDARRDQFGSGDVTTERCASVRRTAWLPEGVDCSRVSGDGFSDSSLP